MNNQNNQVTVSAVPFNPQTQQFTATSPQQNALTSFNQSMVKPSVTLPSNLPQPSTTINATTLSGVNPLNIPTSQPTTPKPTTNYTSYTPTITTPYSDTDKNLSKLMLDILPNLQGQSAELQKQKQAFNVADLQKKQQEYNTQILTKQAELQQDDVRLAQSLQNIEDQTIPMEFITGQQASVERRAQLARGLKVSEINMLNALSLSAQGNTDLAIQQAQDATEAKFAPFKEMYTLIQEQQKAIQPYVNEEQKQVAEINSQIAAYKLKELDINQKNSDKFLDFAIKAQQDYGATPEMVSQAFNTFNKTGDIYQAAQNLMGYGGEQYINNLNFQNNLRNTTQNSYGQITQENGYTFDMYKKGIASTESSNNYKAIGPATSSGDKAYGKYQVMGANIPSWTKQALGYSMTPTQFLNSPDAQEKVFENQSLTNYAKYGNWDDVASVWFSGRPLSGNISSDGYNTVPQYVAKVRKAMGVPAQPTTYSQVVNPQVETWAKFLKDNGNDKDALAKVPKYLQTQVLAYNQSNINNTPAIDSLNSKILQIDNIINNPAIGAVVGPNILGRSATDVGGIVGRTLAGLGTGVAVGAGAGSIVPGAGTVLGGLVGGIVGGGSALAGSTYQALPQFSGQAQNFIGDVEQLTSKEFIDNLINVKGQGATFGALTEKEGMALRDAATKLNNWKITDSNGKTIGYNIDEANFIKELNNIKQLAQKGIVYKGGNILGGNVTDVYYNNIIPQVTTSTIQTNYGGYNF